jgi:hypothetical protein
MRRAHGAAIERTLDASGMGRGRGTRRLGRTSERPCGSWRDPVQTIVGVAQRDLRNRVVARSRLSLRHALQGLPLGGHGRSPVCLMLIEQKTRQGHRAGKPRAVHGQHGSVFGLRHLDAFRCSKKGTRTSARRIPARSCGVYRAEIDPPGPQGFRQEPLANSCHTGLPQEVQIAHQPLVVTSKVDRQACSSAEH